VIVPSGWYVTDPVADSVGLPHQPGTADFATRYDLMPAADTQDNSSSYTALTQEVAPRRGHPVLGRPAGPVTAG
jgi:hypothetical protein